MKFSVLIPVYNAEKTIEDTLKSVFAQTIKPYEVIILLDGCNDKTEKIVEKYKEVVEIIKQPNNGIAKTRNKLVSIAQGDILAFIDSDDIWHPKYLETKRELFERYPQVIACFTGHLRYLDGRSFNWPDVNGEKRNNEIKILNQVEFFQQYNRVTAVYGSMSYCCVKKIYVEKMGIEPFSNNLNAVEDSYFCYQLALLGKIAFDPEVLVAYRLIENSLSENRLRNLELWSEAFRILESKYHSMKCTPSSRQKNSFYKVDKDRRRACGKCGKVVDFSKPRWESPEEISTEASFSTGRARRSGSDPFPW